MQAAKSVALAALVASAPFLSSTASLSAQEALPTPSPELAKLQPLIGNWTGSGTMTEPGATTKWTATGSYRWVLGKFWVQEDFVITFEGHASPLAFRGYLGFDSERGTLVNASVNNGGEAQLHDMTFLPDGTVLQLMLQHQQGMPYAERSLLKVDGDTMTHTIDLLMASGPSMTIVDGKFTRRDKPAPSALDEKGTWMGAVPHEPMRKLARMVGSYEGKGSFVPMPGAPPTPIKGVDVIQMVFGGTVLHCRTEGEGEGMPGKYEAEAFWAWNAKKGCFAALSVTNMGELAMMDARFGADGKALIATVAGTMMGQPAVMRMVTRLDDKGRAVEHTGHLLFGAEPPLQNFTMTYAVK